MAITQTNFHYTSIMSNDFERFRGIESSWLVYGMKRYTFGLSTTQFGYWKDLGISKAFLYVFHTLQSALDRRPEVRIVMK